MKNLHLVDDGTMDTVFYCEQCSQQVRYSNVETDSEGYILEEEISSIEADHANECEGPPPETLSHHALACDYHSGQWSALYAFSSTGTVTETLSSEIRSALAHAEKMAHHPAEINALKEFLEWAKTQESNKFPTEKE